MNFVDAGAAYVFVKPAAGWSGNLGHSAKPIASDRAQNDRFGANVGLDHDVIVVGAPLDSPGTTAGDHGSAYVFLRPAGGWTGTLTENAKLTASDAEASDLFGTSARVQGDAIQVGAPAASGAPAADAGAAYLFRKPAGGWSGALVETEKLTASDGATGDRFGSPSVPGGDLIAVGATGDDAGAGVDQGSVYLLARLVADAGPDQTVAEGALVTLDGSASTGGGGAFHWAKLAGPAVVLDDPTPSAAPHGRAWPACGRRATRWSGWTSPGSPTRTATRCRSRSRASCRTSR